MLHRTSKGEAVPRRKREVPNNPLDRHADFQELRAHALSGELKPGEMAWIELEPKSAARLKMKNPARVMADNLRREFLSAGLSHLKPVRYRNDAGRWIVGVKRAPAEEITRTDRAKSA
jgi:hypothetical protein